MSLVILFLHVPGIQSVLRVINQTYPIGSKMTQLILNSIQPLSIAVCLPGNDGALLDASKCELKNTLCYAGDYLYGF